MRLLHRSGIFFFAIALIAFCCLSLGGALRGQQPGDPPAITENPVPPGESIIEAVFVLDTTGSMGGLIQGAKEKIWSIANTLVTNEPKPIIKFGLIGYRDRSDAYITKITPLTGDIDAVYTDLMAFTAEGGGDGPESVNQALHEAVTKIAWSKASGIYRVIFLVGDYPPHMDYEDDVKYQESCRLATEAHIVINTIQCGGYEPTTPFWQEIARLAEGRFFQVAQSGGAVTVATPFDEKLTSLARELDGTRLYYGTKEEQAHGKLQNEAADEITLRASVSSNAERAAYNAKTAPAGPAGPSASVSAFDSDSSKDFINDLTAGTITLDKVDEKLLPENMRKMTAGEREAYVKELQEKRKQLLEQITGLSAQRAQFQQQELARLGEKGKDSFDAAIVEAVTTQRAARQDTTAPAREEPAAEAKTE